MLLKILWKLQCKFCVENDCTDLKHQLLTLSFFVVVTDSWLCLCLHFRESFHSAVIIGFTVFCFCCWEKLSAGFFCTFVFMYQVAWYKHLLLFFFTNSYFNGCVKWYHGSSSRSETACFVHVHIPWNEHSGSEGSKCSELIYSHLRDFKKMYYEYTCDKHLCLRENTLFAWEGRGEVWFEGYLFLNWVLAQTIGLCGSMVHRVSSVFIIPVAL